ncbi:thioredoxin domain-containing protein [Streptomyces sp. XD-27]|uniref:thioredoxin domain-containing protein n=1 Tax=Streptomyces sp. XD-27 TaxID=3062779 RepID=UPI0026F44F9E|nr:thioredoxin domain-containing protein [Streptomyces sp. XD-27]WKX69815.1 thioredoxin domain-containing protein [Streptomyces sp. XD-27]
MSGPQAGQGPEDQQGYGVPGPELNSAPTLGAGQPLAPPPQPPGHPQPPHQPPLPPQPYPHQAGWQPYPPQQPHPPAPDAGGRRKRIGAIAAAVAALAVVAGAVALFTTGDDKDKSNTAGDGSKPGGGTPTAPASPSATTGDTGSTGDSEGTGDTGGTGSKGELVKPAHSSGADGTTVVIGKPSAQHTLDLYQDPRCPPCSIFEQNVGATVIKDIKSGRYKASFHLATFLDDSFGGSGSKNAVSALGAALDVSPDAFLSFKQALYSAQYYPQGHTDSFGDDAYLLKVARTVPALAKDKAVFAKFEKNVRGGTYDVWAQKMGDAFTTAKDVTGTPTLKLDGTRLTGGSGLPPMTAEEFDKAVGERL